MKKLLSLLLFLTGFSAPCYAQATYFTFDSLANPPYICQAHVFNVEIFGMVADGSTQLSSQHHFVSQDTVYVRAYFVAGTGPAIPYPLNLNFIVPAPGIGLYKIVAQGFYQGQLHKTLTSQIGICSSLTGVSKPANKGLTMQVYPNPVLEKVQITVPLTKTEAQVSLLDLTGKCVLNKRVASGNPSLLLDLSRISPGLYLLQYQNDDILISEKILKH